MKVVSGRISLVRFLQQPPLNEAFWFATGTTSVSILFKLTRLALAYLQKQLRVKFEFTELILSGAVSSLGMLLFNKSDLPTLKALLYMRAAQCLFLMIQGGGVNSSLFARFILPMFGYCLIIGCVYHEIYTISPGYVKRVLNLLQA